MSIYMSSEETIATRVSKGESTSDFDREEHEEGIQALEKLFEGK
jgi:hypothetical protein